MTNPATVFIYIDKYSAHNTARHYKNADLLKDLFDDHNLESFSLSHFLKKLIFLKNFISRANRDLKFFLFFLSRYGRRNTAFSEFF